MSKAGEMIDGFFAVLDAKNNRGWLLIETAPKDGTAILGFQPRLDGVYASRQDVSVIHWSGWGGGVWEQTGGGKVEACYVTHWMPLPNPPSPA